VIDEPELTPEEEARLSDLIREAEASAPPDHEEPEIAQLLAYVQGRLGPDEMEAVQKALSRSPVLREEVLALAALRNPEAGERFRTVPVPPVPARPFVGGVPHPSWFRRHRVLWGSGTAGLAAAALLAVVLMRPSSEPPFADGESWETTRSLRAEQFERDPNRGGVEDLRPRNREQAETLSFLRLLELRDGQLVVNPELAVPVATTRNLVILMRGGKDPATPYGFRVPATAESLRAAYLSLPELGVYALPLDADTLRTERPGTSAQGALTISFVDNGEPGSATAIPTSP
jgi:hypothetical protein